MTARLKSLLKILGLVVIFTALTVVASVFPAPLRMSGWGLMAVISDLILEICWK